MKKSNFLFRKIQIKGNIKLLSAWVLFVFFLHNYFFFQRLLNNNVLYSLFFLFLILVSGVGIIFIIKKIYLKNFPPIFTLDAFIIKPIWLFIILFIFLIIFIHADSFILINPTKWGDLIHLALTIGKSFLAAGIFFLVSYGIGKKILNLFKIETKQLMVNFLFSVGLGIITLSFITYLLSALAMAYSLIVYAIVVVAILISWSEIKYILKILFNSWITFSRKEFDRFEYMAIMLLGILLFLGLFSSLATLLSAKWDSFHQYLLFPFEYAKEHRLIFYPYHPYWGFPQAGEMTFLLAILLGGMQTAFVQNYFFLILTLLGVNALLGFIAKNWRIWILTSIIIFPPLMFYTFGYIKIEPLFTFITTLIFLTLYELFHSNESNQKKKYWILLSIFLGILMIIKYTAALFIIALGIILLNHRKYLEIGIKKWILLGLIVAALFSPWAIKNIWYYQQAFYPILAGVDTIKKTTGLQCHKELIATSNEDIFLIHNHEPLKTKSTLLAKILLASTLFFLENGMKIGDFGFALAFFLPLFFIHPPRKENRFMRMLYGFTIVYTILWLVFFAGQAWYLLPSFLSFMLVIGFILSQKYPKETFRTPQILMLIWLILTIYVILNGNSISQKSKFIRQENSFYEILSSSLDDYQDKNKSFIHQLQARQYINNVILTKNPNALIYGFEEPQGFFINQSYKHLIPDFFGYLWQCFSQKSDNIYQSLKNLGVTHIWYNTMSIPSCIFPENKDKFQICQSLISLQKFIQDHSLPIEKQFNTIILYQLP